MSFLYVSDLDGTLLTNEPRLSSNSESRLRELLERGLRFSVASARSVTSIRQLLRGLPITLPVIEFNGAFVSDLSTGRHEIVNAMAPDLVCEIYGHVVALGHRPFLSTFDGRQDCLYAPEVSNEGARWYLDDRIANRDPRLRDGVDLGDALAQQVVCLTVIGRLESLSELEGAIRAVCDSQVEMHLFENHYSPGWYWLTVHDWRARKDRGVRAMMELCGLTDHSVVAFGNDLNDVGLFNLAVERVAVANAHSELKRHATCTIGSNETDSVVTYIHEHWHRTALHRTRT